MYLIDLVTQTRVYHSSTDRPPDQGGIEKRVKGLPGTYDHVLLKIISQVLPSQVEINRVLFSNCFTHLRVHNPERRGIILSLIDPGIIPGGRDSLRPVQVQCVIQFPAFQLISQIGKCPVPGSKRPLQSHTTIGAMYIKVPVSQPPFQVS